MTIMIRAAYGLVLILCIAGCGYSVSMKGEPVNVSGKLSSGGAPLGGITVTFQPLEDGHVAPIKVNTDGSFSGKMVPGKYAYYIADSSNSDAEAMAKVPVKYREPDMGRTISVRPDNSTFELTFD